MASALYATALLLGKFDIAHDFVAVRSRDHCADLGIWILRQAHPKRGNSLRKFRYEAIVDGTLHEDARAAKANLTLVRERREQGAAEHGFKVAVCKNHVGIFTAQFKTELFKARRRQGIDARASGGSARERDKGNVGVRNQGFAYARSRSVHDVQHAGWEADLVKDFAQHVGRVGRNLRRLGDYRVAGGKGRSNLPAK